MHVSIRGLLSPRVNAQKLRGDTDAQRPNGAHSCLRSRPEIRSVGNLGSDDPGGWRRDNSFSHDEPRIISVHRW